MDGGKPENPIKMDDLGVPLFLETSKWLLFMGSEALIHPSGTKALILSTAQQPLGKLVVHVHVEWWNDL